ncbi:MAG TPA: hypothetical protein VD736_04060 [Nitrososphaera sp.]|nr:hypothetical protein [Nitrososphaera sp.]
MAAGFPAHPQSRVHGRTYLWFQRNAHRLLAADIVCIALLFFMHLFTSTFHVFTQDIAFAVKLAAIAPAAFIALSVVMRGMVPLIICALGIVLMHNAVILPFYEPEPGEATIDGRLYTWTLYTPTSVSVGSSMNFFLGLGMVAFSIIIAYRPSILFARNRPESLEDEWSKYSVWHDNALLAHGRQEPSVPVKSLMTDQDRYLLWRYEYVLADVYDTPHLVRPNGTVPKDSTRIFRDKDSGRVIGKARYTGFFM